ncbi:MAG: 8-oxoguanine deaminase [Chloroflexota bacterium]
MTILLLKNAAVIATMNDTADEIKNGAIYVENNLISQIGTTADLEHLTEQADRVIDLSGHVVLPGLVNTHHHMYQTLTRAMVQDGTLFQWLVGLYPIWAGLTDEMVYISTLTASAELLLSGCTTSSDHLYIFPNDCTLDSQIRAAGEIGIRFHAARGSMSLGESAGGLPPDKCVEDEPSIMKDTVRLIETYHDPDPQSMMRIVVAPCSPFSVTPKLMKEAAELARNYKGVQLHTHLAETLDEEEFCISKFGKRPVALMEDFGWLGSDVWHAHCVHMNDDEIHQFGQSQTGIAHCPTSNMRLGSGIPPICSCLNHHVPVGLGVDGSASNDGSHLLAEARQAMLLQRVQEGADAFSGRQALNLATRGGAKVLGRDDIGYLAPGMSADLIAIDLNRLPYAGATHDPVSAVIFCQPQQVDWSIINGKVVVEKGSLLTVDTEWLTGKHNQLAHQLIKDF